MIVYVNEKYLEENDAQVNVNDRGYLFADGVYEGFRIYNGKIFKLQEHKNRFQRSLDELKISYSLKDEIEEVFKNLFKKNNYLKEDELFYYMQITRGVAPRDHGFQKEKPKAGIYAFLSKKKINLDAYNNGVKICTTADNRWARCDIKCISLIANCLAKQTAVEDGFFDALFVHDGVITEGTSTNVCFIKDDILYTHAATNRILSGVTRNFVLDLCKENDIKVVEFPLTTNKISDVDEAFLTGTSGEITPIIKIDNITIGNGKSGKITKKLQKYYREYVNNNFY
ncbi:D-amino-acid transaminase [Arcobacter sp. LA11]|uniref:D-amino-acid transaminase n=1 Tax=Arcobacter sp. LA11 TaxID=1898176 RepID=UPI0009F9C84C|nr:D-amino-acid transaminase [Arcobacter sp. LA11]